MSYSKKIIVYINRRKAGMEDNIMEDSEIIELYFNRKEQAIQESEKKYGNYCRSIAYGILDNKEDTEESLNDTWLKAWNSIPPVKPLNLRVYLGTIVRNTSMNIYKKYHTKKRYNTMNMLLSEIEECISFESPIDKYFETRELSSAISRWLRSIEIEDRRIFLQRYWYAKSVKYLADCYGISANTMTQKLKRLREKLREYLESEEISI